MNQKTLRDSAGASLAAHLMSLLALLAPNVHGQALQRPAFELITAAEARAEADAPPAGPRTRSMPRPDATAIRVLAPVPASAVVPAPLHIELAFRAAPGARIVPASFRVFYGVLKIDLTERLKPHAAVTEQGVVVDGAQVPDGLHRLSVQVADDKGGSAEQELLIRVGRPS